MARHAPGCRGRRYVRLFLIFGPEIAIWAVEHRIIDKSAPHRRTSVNRGFSELAYSYAHRAMVVHCMRAALGGACSTPGRRHQMRCTTSPTLTPGLVINVFQVPIPFGLLCCYYTRYKNIRGCGSIMKAAAIAVHASAVRLRATAAPEPAEAAELTVPRYQQLGLRPANALTDLVHTEIANLVKSQVVPPPPPPNPPTPPPPEPANPQYYLNRRHISGRDRWHHQRFGRSLSADLRPQPESMLFTWPSSLLCDEHAEHGAHLVSGMRAIGRQQR